MENHLIKIEKSSDITSDDIKSFSKNVVRERLEEHVQLPDLKQESTNENSEIIERDIVSVRVTSETIKDKCQLQNTNDNRFECSKCFRTFGKPENLEAHLWDKHKIGSFKCDICNKILKRKRTFEEHCNFHKKVYNYKCEICPSQFVRLGQYKIHMGTHNNKMPSWCMKCGQCFMRVMDCRRHEHVFEHKSDIRAKVTGEQNVKRCDICRKSFYNLDCLNEHAKSHPVKKKIAKDKNSKQGCYKNEIQM